MSLKGTMDLLDLSMLATGSGPKAENTKRSDRWAAASWNTWALSKVMPNGRRPPTLYELKDYSDSQLVDDLCSFVSEVRKQNGEKYPPHTLYQLCCALNRCVKEAKPHANILDEGKTPFSTFTSHLAKEMRALMSQGVPTSGRGHGQPLTREQEEYLWDRGIIGFDTAQKLQWAVFLNICKTFHIVSRDDHWSMTIDQYKFGSDEFGSYVDFHGKRGTSRQYDVSGDRRCLYKLLLNYLHHLPKIGPFYLKPVPTDPPSIQFAPKRVGIHSISKFLKDIVRVAGFPGHYTNHSISQSPLLSARSSIDVPKVSTLLNIAPAPSTPATSQKNTTISSTGRRNSKIKLEPATMSDTKKGVQILDQQQSLAKPYGQIGVFGNAALVDNISLIKGLSDLYQAATLMISQDGQSPAGADAGLAAGVGKMQSSPQGGAVPDDGKGDTPVMTALEPNHHPEVPDTAEHVLCSTRLITQDGASGELVDGPASGGGALFDGQPAMKRPRLDGSYIQDEPLDLAAGSSSRSASISPEYHLPTQTASENITQQAASRKRASPTPGKQVDLTIGFEASGDTALEECASEPLCLARASQNDGDKQGPRAMDLAAFQKPTNMYSYHFKLSALLENAGVSIGDLEDIVIDTDNEGQFGFVNMKILCKQ